MECKASGFTARGASKTSNVFKLKDIKSPFTTGDTVIFCDYPNIEHEIRKAVPVSSNTQRIILKNGTGFKTNKGMAVSIVKRMIFK